MIVKILSSSGTFAGVTYNQDKVAKGTAELLAAENFGMLHLGSSGTRDTDYKGYFQTWSRSRDNVQTVKQPQFHAVLSCEGREKTRSQLQEMAEQYLRKMGYGENPYLIYFHADTANNHVHIVSTRISPEGRKIADSFERTRSQKAIQEILLQDVGEEVKAHVRQAMRYTFSTPAQFKMLLEMKRVKVGETGAAYRFIKYGSVVDSMEKETLAEKIASYKPPEERIRQLRALFSKYKPGLATGAFKSFLKDKFGVELVFHQAKGKQEPYGYSIIDHAQQQVLKGSQVMKLSELLSVASRQDRIDAAQAIIRAVSKDSALSYGDFREQLKEVGFSVNHRGEVKLKGETAQDLQVNPEVMKRLHYHERLQQARNFTITGAADIHILSRVFYLKAHHLAVNGHPDEEARAYAADRLNSMLTNGRQLSDILYQNGWSIVRLEGQHYLLDKREKTVHNLKELTGRRLDYSTVEVVGLDTESGRGATQQAAYSSGSVGDLLALLAQTAREGARQPQEERKNIRRIKR